MLGAISSGLTTGVTPAVHRELAAMLRYARAIHAARCYFAGALTVLERLELISAAESRLWSDGLAAELRDL